MPECRQHPSTTVPRCRDGAASRRRATASEFEACPTFWLELQCGFRKPVDTNQQGSTPGTEDSTFVSRSHPNVVPSRLDHLYREGMPSRVRHTFRRVPQHITARASSRASRIGPLMFFRSTTLMDLAPTRQLRNVDQAILAIDSELIKARPSLTVSPRSVAADSVDRTFQLTLASGHFPQATKGMSAFPRYLFQANNVQPRIRPSSNLRCEFGRDE